MSLEWLNMNKFIIKDKESKKVLSDLNKYCFDCEGNLIKLHKSPFSDDLYFIMTISREDIESVFDIEFIE